MTEQNNLDFSSDDQLFCDEPIFEKIRGLERTLEFCGKGHPAPPRRETGP